MSRQRFQLSLALALGCALLVLCLVVLQPSTPSLGHPLDTTSVAPAATDAAPDVGVWKWNLGGSARPGGKIVYGLVYWNDGDTVAEDVLIVDTLPDSTTWAGDTSGLTPDIGANGTVTWHVGALPALGNGDNWGVFAVTLDVDSAVITGSGVISGNCATISTTTLGDTNPDNDTACTDPVDVWESDVGLNVDVWPNPGDPTPGQEFDYTIRWCSEHEANFGPVWLTDTLPVSTTVVGWNTNESPQALWAEATTTGGQFALYAPGLPGDWCQHINMRLLLAPEAPQGLRLENHVVVATPGDSDTDNNERLNQDAWVSVPRTDLSVNKTMHQGVLVPDGWINYVVWYGNQGNIAVPVRITETIPTGLSFDSAYWGGGQPGEGEALPAPTVIDDTLIWQLDELPVNGSRWFHIRMAIDTLEAGDEVTNCVTVGSDGDESTPHDNLSCHTERLNASGPNLRVRKEHWWNGDGQLGYRVRFSNLGDEIISGVSITDTLPDGTDWDGWWEIQEIERDRVVGEVLDSDVLVWRFSMLDPGEAGNLEFNADLTDAWAPLRWFTNTVEITLPADDTQPADNAFTDVAFSGGEVRRAEMWLGTDHADMWGESVSVPVTITTAYTQVVVWGDPGCNGCWDTQSGLGPIWPGDTVVVEAGAGLQPVTIVVPDPFDVAADSATNTVWGRIAGAQNQQIQVEGYWPGGHRDTWTNTAGEYSVTYLDVPRGAQGHARYETAVDYAQVMFHRRFQTPDLLITVDYSQDGVDGNYEPGHTGWVTVTSDVNTEIKATVEVTTEAWPWWGGSSGFSTHHHTWFPSQPDIQPGDWVYATLDNGHGTAVRVGTINATLDVDGDVVSGVLDAPWFTEALEVRCEIHEQDAPAIDVGGVDPNGGAFACDFSGMWDITPGQNVVVVYTEPDGDRVQFRPANPAPHLRIEKRLEGGALAEGGNAVFYIRYDNEGDAGAEGVVITDTLRGLTYLSDTSGSDVTTGTLSVGDGYIAWDLGTVAARGGAFFYVFAEVDASAGNWVTNTAEIATGNPFDRGEPAEKRSEWSGEIQPNDAQLNVGTWAWTGDPAPGQDVVFAVNACNFGTTASAEVLITDTLHPSLTLQTWWGQHAGWREVSRSDHELVVALPAAPAGWCGEVYVRAKVAAEAWTGMPISNTATLYAANDLSTDDDLARWDGFVGNPYTNLFVDKRWNWGQLVPGGELRYNIHIGNGGNLPVGAFRITDTLPANTTFVAGWTHDQTGSHPFPPASNADGIVVWEVDELDNGFGQAFEVVLRVAQDAAPGSILTNTAEATCLAGEGTCHDNVSAWAETLLNNGPNLRVSKWGDWHGDRPGHAWYGFAVENVGSTTIPQAVVTDTYPALMSLEDGVNTDWSRVAHFTEEPSQHRFAATLNDLQPGYRIDFDFNMSMGDWVPSGLILTNTVTAGPVVGDAYPDDDTARYALSTGPDLYVEKNLVGGEFGSGELVTFSLRFGNDQRGHTPWWNLQGSALLTDTLPAGLEYVGARQRWCEMTDWCDRAPDRWDGSSAVWELWPLQTGEWNELYVTLRITETATVSDSFTNWAAIGSTAPISDVEPTYGNNSSSVSFAIGLSRRVYLPLTLRSD